MLLVMNKYDLVQDIEEKGQKLEDYMTQGYLNNFAQEYGFIGAIRVSAKTGHNVTEAFE